MNDMDYLACDEEVFAMVNNNRQNRPVAVLVPMEKLQQVERYDRRMQQLKGVRSLAAPICVGLFAVGAMARDLMSPGLAICVLGGCMIWAAVKFWRGGNG